MNNIVYFNYYNEFERIYKIYTSIVENVLIKNIKILLKANCVQLYLFSSFIDRNFGKAALKFWHI